MGLCLIFGEMRGGRSLVEQRIEFGSGILDGCFFDFLKASSVISITRRTAFLIELARFIRLARVD